MSVVWWRTSHYRRHQKLKFFNKILHLVKLLLSTYTKSRLTVEACSSIGY